jgi:NAD(P)-dependent dehydrogenase (short-subunit alcohol dehydrogenase family)
MNTVLITGANRGLGLEFAKQYSDDGWQVIACCRSPDAADELQQLAKHNKYAQIERLDVNDFDAVDALAVKYSNQEIDVLLNNAGVIGALPIAENIERQFFGKMDYGLWAEVLRTNTFAPVKMAEAFLGNVAASEQKKIVSISSSVGSIAEMSIPALAYASSKSALNRVMTTIAGAVKDQGVTVALLCPGYAKTRMDVYGAAVMEVPESVSMLRNIIDKLTIADSGLFIGHDGRKIPW